MIGMNRCQCCRRPTPRWAVCERCAKLLDAIEDRMAERIGAKKPL